MPTMPTLRRIILVASAALAFGALGCELEASGTDESANSGDLANVPGDEGRSESSGASSDRDSATSMPALPGDPTKPGDGMTAPAGGSSDAGGASGTNGASDSGGGAPDAAPGDASDPGDAVSDSGTSQPQSDAGARRCGTRGGSSCGDEQFCNFEPDADCGGTDRGGVCASKPQVCTAQYAPVCGCDRRTYSNRCAAHGAGVSVKADGPCSIADCEAAGGKVKSSTGADIPMCSPNEEQWNLVGGLEPLICCKKKSGGMQGPKPGDGKMCGGFAGLQCDGDDFCNYGRDVGGDGCENIADGAGVCKPRPMGCTRDYKPVCGCDHRSYPNACTANAAGVSVMRTDLCTEKDCEKAGGKTVFGLGPPPMCPSGSVSWGNVRLSNGNMPIEGAICCGPR